jgi:hypothetical protein
LGAYIRACVFHCGHKYCHNGAWPFAHEHGSDWLGVHFGDHGPFRRSPKNSWFAGENCAGPGSVPFGDRHGLVCLLPSQREQVLPQRGHGLRPPSRRHRRPRWRSWPFRRSLETAGLQGKYRRVRGPCPLGAATDSSAFWPSRREKYWPNGAYPSVGSPYHPRLWLNAPEGRRPAARNQRLLDRGEEMLVAIERDRDGGVAEAGRDVGCA